MNGETRGNRIKNTSVMGSGADCTGHTLDTASLTVNGQHRNEWLSFSHDTVYNNVYKMCFYPQ